jgi:hypothetical protein
MGSRNGFAGRRSGFLSSSAFFASFAVLSLHGGAAKAQDLNGSLALRFDDETNGERLFDRAPLSSASRYVMVRLSENRLYVMEGERAIWSAPARTTNWCQTTGSTGAPKAS